MPGLLQFFGQWLDSPEKSIFGELFAGMDVDLAQGRGIDASCRLDDFPGSLLMLIGTEVFQDSAGVQSPCYRPSTRVSEFTSCARRLTVRGRS